MKSRINWPLVCLGLLGVAAIYVVNSCGWQQ